MAPGASSFVGRTITGYQPPPSAFSRVPLSHLDPSGSTNVRDSVVTQSSLLSQPTITSSSVYPQSTSAASTASETDSFLSLEVDDDDEEAPMVEEIQNYDGDDVSYRLRLLVKNSYFLPPAHAKPKPSDFAPTPATIPKKPPTPTNSFLDLFRRPKSKPTTPTTTEMPGPILRSTSDSTTTAPYGVSAPRSPLYPPGVPVPSDNHDRAGRVVVVREKMEDLATAAKQAEQEMKERGIRQETSNQQTLDNIIDPTDFVDVPLPSSGYPFAVQASTAHGLGVEESVGAAVLADRLPPESPNSSFRPDDKWRRALLKAAVGHSLEHLNSVTSIPSPASGTTSPDVADKLGLRIINNPILDSKSGTPLSPSPLPKTSPSPNTPLTPTTPVSPVTPAHGAPSPGFSSLIQELPARVETPSAPLTPLQPPPRRQFINPLYSLSQTDLSGTASRASQERRPPSSSSVRKAISSPMLPNYHESDIRPGMTMTPPPLPTTNRVSSSTFSFRGSGATNAGARTASPSVDSFEDAGSTRSRSRASTAPSHRSEGLDPTVSPTASAFQDALSGPPSAFSLQNSARSSFDANGGDPADLVSPPPRVSSSLARLTPILQQPPSSYQSRRFNPQKSYSEDCHGSSSNDNDIPWRPSTTSAQTAPPEIEIFAPEPTTPPLPDDNRHIGANSLSIRIPSTAPAPSIRSAPPPSPTSFFDSIESHLSSELDDSSDEDSDDDDDDDANIDVGPFAPPTRPFVEMERRSQPRRSTTPQPRASGSRTPIMRLGNHSTPYISRTADEQRSLFGSKEAVGHVHTPKQTSFFTDREPVSSTLELYQYAANSRGRSGVRSPPKRPATMEERINQKLAQNKRRDQESLKRLDGMLKQHMQDEKDRIRKITINSRSTNSSTLSQPS
ncbi:hypothetical protein V5O48_016342 [Marasmius crinis-equi]|uniref:Uncharacterized protein n=1 Tax=Marasmius crinis-equi TaxID=585013 RepID=A0ABR3ES08_9AGAR